MPVSTIMLSIKYSTIPLQFLLHLDEPATFLQIVNFYAIFRRQLPYHDYCRPSGPNCTALLKTAAASALVRFPSGLKVPSG